MPTMGHAALPENNGDYREDGAWALPAASHLARLARQNDYLEDLARGLQARRARTEAYQRLVRKLAAWRSRASAMPRAGDAA